MLNKPKAIIIMGVSGSGKTTIGKLLSEKTGITFSDGDDFHPEKNIKKMAAGHALTDKDRLGWLEEINQFCVEKIKSGKSCIVACSALKGSYRKLLRKGIEKNIEFVYLMGSFELIEKRLAHRGAHFMPLSLLKSQFDTLQPPKHAIVVDIADSPEEIVQEIMEQL
ncbi:gluconokinase [Galbibacter mesophilus]|uniref:gluconokinase n=1 Tax=Galbibacter mesophilus TaxID=379069 RepID=UPI00191D8938|nr:gluconokinase [Galbibacter mesophilus]MCM5663554.1 gluconokinase [Galbibacter mesophilus]